MPGSIEASIDLARLDAWAREALPGEGPLEATRLSSGASNEIYSLRRGPHEWILRCPPAALHDPAARNRIMLREFRVLRALEGTPVPHPHPLAACDDPAVIGVTFYVMERVDGFTPSDPLPPPYDADPAARRSMGLEMIDVLADLASVDWRAAGLEGFGKPTGFLERQVDRWLGQLATYRTREIPGIEPVAAWLREHTPPASAPGVMHGDYHFLNVMFRHGAPARMAAVVDWEQSTVGDPLLDLGWLLSGWSDPDDPPPLRFGSTWFRQREGLPTRAELAERYARRTGRDLSHLDYYVVLAMFKCACVLEGGYALHVAGRATNPHQQAFGDIVLRLARDAATLVAGR